MPIDERRVLLPEEVLRKRTRRSFLIGGAAAVAGIGAYEWMAHRVGDDGIPLAERKVLRANGALWGNAVSPARRLPDLPMRELTYLKPNGNIGLGDPIDPDWSVSVKAPGNAFEIGLDDVRALPRVEQTTRFCCIEGWSSVVSWVGARFSDFTRKHISGTLPKYVYLTTPDDQYYVGLDIASAMHPQTLLAYEMNGKPLTPQHGAPLRLVIPVKYGIKNIKRIAAIEYTGKQPSDYWAEEGYDWFAGL